MLWKNLPSGTISVGVLGDRERLESTEYWGLGLGASGGGG